MISNDLSNIVRSDATVTELVAAMDRLGAGIAQLVLTQAGKPVAAIVLIRGADTPVYLASFGQKERELALSPETELSSRRTQVGDKV